MSPHVSTNQKSLEAVIATLSAQARDKAQQDKNDAIVKFYGQLFDKASAYTNILVALGFGGFFATLSATKAYLSHKEILASGLAVLFALFCFIVWHVFIMIMTAKDLNRFEVLVNASVEEFPKVKAAEDLRAARMQYRLRRLWFASVLLTVIPGFGGSLVLIYAIGHHLLWG